MKYDKNKKKNKQQKSIREYIIVMYTFVCVCLTTWQFIVYFKKRFQSSTPKRLIEEKKKRQKRKSQ